MSRARQVERQLDREERRLWDDYNAGLISQADYNAEMRELQRDAREAYEQDMWEAQERVKDEWGG